MEANGCIPDVLTCKLYLDSLIQSGRTEEAQDVLRECGKRGMLLEPITSS